MKKITFITLLLIAFGIVLMVSSCKKENPEEQKTEFDKKAMLGNYSNSVIVPRYEKLENNLYSLKNSVNSFVSAPNLVDFKSLNQSFDSAYLSWQGVSFFQFGPAENYTLKSIFNIFPVDTTLINSNIASNSYNLQTPSNFDAKGLQALDFLLFKNNMTSAQVVDYYTNNSNAQTYLSNVTNEIYTNASEISTEWSTYNQTFINNNTSNAQGSSVSNLINALSLHYEAFVRKGKIGIPSGVFNGISGATLPGHVEGFYSGYSIDFAKQEMSAIQNLINGKTYNSTTDGQGLNDYLDYVLAKSGEQNLSQAIDTKINEIMSLLNDLNGPLSNDVTANGSSVSKVYSARQQLVPLIKVDMTSKLGVLISYADNDGD